MGISVLYLPTDVMGDLDGWLCSEKHLFANFQSQELRKTTKIYFPKWFSRYAGLQKCDSIEVPITESPVIAFSRTLLASGHQLGNDYRP